MPRISGQVFGKKKQTEVFKTPSKLLHAHGFAVKEGFQKKKAESGVADDPHLHP
jgi:hypothetical protein